MRIIVHLKLLKNTYYLGKGSDISPCDILPGEYVARCIKFILKDKIINLQLFLHFSHKSIEGMVPIWYYINGKWISPLVQYTFGGR